MTHVEEKKDGHASDDDLELVGGGHLDDPHENELLAILRKRAASDLKSVHPSIQRSKSAVVLPVSVDHDVADAVKHDLSVVAVPKVVDWPFCQCLYTKFKRKRRGGASSSAQLFRSFLMTPLFREMHAELYSTAQYEEEALGEASPDDELLTTRKRTLQKRFEKLAKPIRDSLELSLSTHMLEAFDHLSSIYTAARRDFLSGMSRCSKMERRHLAAERSRQAKLAEKREKMRLEVDKTKQHLKHAASPSATLSKTPRVRDFLKPAPKRTKEQSFVWKRVKDVERCNPARSLQASIAYARSIHTEGIGGGILTAEALARQSHALVDYVVFIQRLYRGHLARRYVWALQWTCCMWKHLFFPPIVPGSYRDDDEPSSRGFLRLDDFETIYEYFCFQSTPERIYLAGFALTVPPSRLGPQFIEYKRLKRYWHRFMYRGSNPAERIQFVQFVRHRQAALAAMESQRVASGGQGMSELSFLTKSDDWRKFSLVKRARADTQDKYQSSLRSLNDEYRALGLKARRSLLPKDQQTDRGWDLVRDLVHANMMRQLKYKSMQEVVVSLHDKDEFDGRRRISTLREEITGSTYDDNAEKSPSKWASLVKKLLAIVNEAKAVINHFEDVDHDLDSQKSPPACITRLSKVKHVRGLSKIADLVERQHTLNESFEETLDHCKNRKLFHATANRQSIAAAIHYVTESMQIFSLLRRQLQSSMARGLKSTIGSRKVITVHLQKRAEQYHDLLRGFDSNILELSVLFEEHQRQDA
ncbi:unnamed protein product [Aphanomyces euteiches]